jgi:hypothetical protein
LPSSGWHYGVRALPYIEAARQTTRELNEAARNARDAARVLGAAYDQVKDAVEAGALGIVNSALLELNEYVTEQSAILSRTIVREEDKTRAHYSRLLGATSEH